MGNELVVQLAEDGADAERLDALTGFLRRELLELEVEDVTPLRGGEPPPGARVFDVLAVGGLLVTVGHSAESLRAVVTAVRKWLAHGDGIRRTVRMELDGDVLELSEVSVTDQDRLIEVFIGRHATGVGQ